MLADKQNSQALSSTQNITASLLDSAFILKEVAGQINVIVHAVGILIALPHILREGEVIQSLSLGAGNTGKAFDLETDWRVAEFKFIQWRGGQSQSGKILFSKISMGWLRQKHLKNAFCTL